MVWQFGRPLYFRILDGNNFGLIARLTFVGVCVEKTLKLASHLEKRVESF